MSVIMRHNGLIKMFVKGVISLYIVGRQHHSKKIGTQSSVHGGAGSIPQHFLSQGAANIAGRHEGTDSRRIRCIPGGRVEAPRVGAIKEARVANISLRIRFFPDRSYCRP